MPKIIGPVTTDRWEREVRQQFLNQLPDDWIVVCNVAWSTRDAGGYVRDGQSDFVVLVPNQGMVIAEVKGSRSVRVSEDGNWFRTPYSTRGMPAKEEQIEPHSDQATKNMHELEAMVRQAMGWGVFRGTYAYVVIYPNGEATGPPALLDKTTIIGKAQMRDLAARLRASLVARGSEGVRSTFSPSYCAGVAKILSKSGFAVHAVDTELEAAEDDSAIDSLTRQQFAALKGAFELLRVAILGPAGSGKTLLAIWKLKALIEEGRRAVYVCFNKALAEFLRTQHPDCAKAIVNVDSLFRSIAKPQRVNGDLGKFFSEELPQQVLDLAWTLAPDEKYDAILVDEGQDFGDLRVIALLDLLRGDESQWIFFADWNQDVYQTQLNVPLGAEVVFRLYHNCRNTESVTNATNRYCEMRVAPMPGSPKGEAPLIECRSSGEAMAMRAWEIIHQLQPEGGAVILSPYKLENSCMAIKNRGHGLELTQDTAKLGIPGFVFFSTIRSFKGLEAGVVVVVQAEKPGVQPNLTVEDLYVACTRSRSRLAIITGSESSKMWFAGLLQ